MDYGTLKLPFLLEQTVKPKFHFALSLHLLVLRLLDPLRADMVLLLKKWPNPSS